MDTIQRGQRSKELLDDPIIVEALTKIEDTIRQTWEDTTSTEHREELWYTLKGCLRFKEYLTIAVQNGEFELTKRDNP